MTKRGETMNRTNQHRAPGTLPLRLAFLGAYLALAVVPAHAQTVRADYQFQGTLASSVAPAPSLAHLGTNTFQIDSVSGVTRSVLRFPEGNGLALASAGSVVPSDTYTIVVLFRFDTVGSWRRIID